MLLDKLNITLNSLLKKHYAVEFYSENDYYIILSFYHLNSVSNGLAYIEKNGDNITIDFQYHRYNKIVKNQIENIGKYIKNLYNLKQQQKAFDIMKNYKYLYEKIYNMEV